MFPGGRKRACAAKALKAQRDLTADAAEARRAPIWKDPPGAASAHADSAVAEEQGAWRVEDAEIRLAALRRASMLG